MWRMLAASIVGLVGMSQIAAAADLVAGGYVGHSDEPAADSERPGTMSFGFTPRGSATDRLRFDLTAAPLEVAPEPRAATSLDGGDDGFVLGGALVWNDWTFNSTMQQLSEGRFQTELVGAGVAYGGVAARLALAETETPVGETRSTMLLSTDLAAWSWLTLEGDLAFTGRSEGRPDGDAAGRFGIRLSF